MWSRVGQGPGIHLVTSAVQYGATSVRGSVFSLIPRRQRRRDDHQPPSGHRLPATRNKKQTKGGTHDCMSICCPIWSILVIYKKNNEVWEKTTAETRPFHSALVSKRPISNALKKTLNATVPTAKHTGWKMDTLCLLVSICRNWQRHVCPCDPLGRRRRKKTDYTTCTEI